MQMTTVSPKSQIPIPRPIHDHLCLKPGQKTQAMEYRGRVEQVPERDISELQGFVKGINTDFSRDEDRV